MPCLTGCPTFLLRSPEAQVVFVLVESTGLQDKLCKCSFLSAIQSRKMLEKLDKKWFFCKKEEEEETDMILIGIHLLCDFIVCEYYAASICYVTTNGLLKLLKRRISTILLHNSGLEDFKDEMGQGEVSKTEDSPTAIQENKILTCLCNSWKMLLSGISDLLLEGPVPPGRER